ncbi:MULTISPECIES: hypothetical protein [unclassified Lentimicrobium]|uniref:hypothetical protein n=1 Tax=unclassified Lentimicrobium TaxID=2677434 RepID=UPI0015548B09|nr:MULTISPECIES: hypothetical protein [unclassified Lentimicrobium]NPD47657.1 hypothetical protein [Lentimicrobium sp. S6]NPD86611.1 hypothetical protein [Lentimicrobium sp. L6]
MKRDLIDILKIVRTILIKDGVKSLKLKNVSDKSGLSIEELKKHFKDDKELITKLLEFERHAFIEIFQENDFEGVNAIDIMMFVGKQLSDKYDYITPSYSSDIRKHFPDIYEEHFQSRTDFIFEKIRINLTKGISQGMYRSDLSIELISRLYISRLWDIHNEDFFPPEKFSFDTLYEFMFDNLISSIATEEGLKYYKNKGKKAKL